jgi:4-amino-4-deoxy-L-arabinose transferase-like glycosyltransferase
MVPKGVLSVTGPYLSKAALVAAFGYVVLHLVTLDRSPTPYFDDTFFASVTDALRSTGELRLEISPLYFGKPVYIYGPLYFAAAAGVLEVLGFGSFQFRLIALSFGLGIIWLLYKLLRVGGASHGMGLVICALLAIDPTFYKSLHSGRMDSMALFLLLLSLYLVLLPEPGRSISRVTRIVLSGIAAPEHC